MYLEQPHHLQATMHYYCRSRSRSSRSSRRGGGRSRSRSRRVSKRCT